MDKVLAIVGYNGKILIGKVKKNKAQDFGDIPYIFPGGETQESENLEKAVVREVKEETGLEVTVIEKIGERIHPVTGAKIHYFLCRSSTNKTSVKYFKNDDIEKLLWVLPKEIKNYLPTLNPKVEKFLEEVKN